MAGVKDLADGITALALISLASSVIAALLSLITERRRSKALGKAIGRLICRKCRHCRMASFDPRRGYSILCAYPECREKRMLPDGFTGMDCPFLDEREPDTAGKRECEGGTK